MTFKQYLLEKNQLKAYPIQIPPSSREGCVKLMKQSKRMSQGPWVKNINGKDVEIDFEDAIKEWSMSNLQHETVHALQDLNIPEIFKNLPELSHKFGSSEEYKKKHYYNRPTEIMAYAYDTAMGVDSAKNEKTYKEIGGEVYELFQHYVKEYKK